MTRIGHQNLSAGNLTGVINYPRTIEYLVMYNNNPAPLYVRLGSPEIPNQKNYDIAVPPNYIMAISVNSNQFGFRLGDTGITTALLTGNTVIEGMIDEAPPALGGVPIQAASLATAELTNGLQTFAGVTTLTTFNLSLWGGLLVYVSPDVGSGQGVIQINISSDGATWKAYRTASFWPNIPVSITVPRVATFVQIILNATAIVGEPAISGVVLVRAALTEIGQYTYNPTANALVKTYNLVGIASQQYTFVTAGLPAVSVAAIATTGSTSSAAITFLVEATSDLVNWRQVTARDQLMSQGVTLYRALGNLDLFIRVTIFQLTAGQTGVGSVYMSIPFQADLGYILNTIQQSLGDKNAPSNTNQDIYHQLDTIRSTLVTYQTYQPNLAGIFTNTQNIDTEVQTLHTDLIHASGLANASGTVPPGVGYVNLGVASNFPANCRVTSVRLLYSYPNLVGPPGGIIAYNVALGTNAAAGVTIAQFALPVLGGFSGAVWNEFNPRAGQLDYQLAYPNTPGFVNGTFQNVWVNSPNVAGMGNSAITVILAIQN